MDLFHFKSNPDISMKKNMEIEKAVKGFVGQKGAHTNLRILLEAIGS